MAAYGRFSPGTRTMIFTSLKRRTADLRSAAIVTGLTFCTAGLRLDKPVKLVIGLK